MLTGLGFLEYNGILSLFLIALDILVVAFIIYKIIMLIKGTRAVQLVKGLAVIIAVYFISDLLNLTTLNWIMRQLQLMIVVAIPIVFQPELRRALEQLGRGRIFTGTIPALGAEEMSRLINETVRAVDLLRKEKRGALIVFERKIGLKDYVETGVKIDAAVSMELLVNIFSPKSPLHDGAVILRGDRIAAAGCFLPLTDSPYLSKQLGTRHRAALGITEHSDAVVIIVSEETGVVSLAHEGELTRFLDKEQLKEILEEILITRGDSAFNFNFLWPFKKS